MADFTAYHIPGQGEARLLKAWKAVKDAGHGWVMVRCTTNVMASKHAGVADVRMPRFYLGFPMNADWKGIPKVNNGGLRWLLKKVAEIGPAEAPKPTPEPPESPPAAPKPAPAPKPPEKQPEAPAAPSRAVYRIPPFTGTADDWTARRYAFDVGWGLWVPDADPREKMRGDDQSQIARVLADSALKGRIWPLTLEQRADWQWTKTRVEGQTLVLTVDLEAKAKANAPPPPILVPLPPRIILRPFTDDGGNLSCRFSWEKRIDADHPSVDQFRAFWGCVSADPAWVPFRSEHVHGDSSGTTVFWNREPVMQKFIAALESDAGISDWTEVTISFATGDVIRTRQVPRETYPLVRVEWKRLFYRAEIYKDGEWRKVPGRFVWPLNCARAAVKAYHA